MGAEGPPEVEATKEACKTHGPAAPGIPASALPLADAQAAAAAAAAPAGCHSEACAAAQPPATPERRAARASASAAAARAAAAPRTSFEDWGDFLLAEHGLCAGECPGETAYLTNRHSRSLTARLRRRPLRATLNRFCVPSPEHRQPISSTLTGSPSTPSQILEALRRLGVLGGPDSGPLPEELRITIAGADRNEGRSAAETAGRLSALCRAVAAAGVPRMRVLLCGPNLPKLAAAETFQLPPCHSGPRGRAAEAAKAAGPGCGSREQQPAARRGFWGVIGEEFSATSSDGAQTDAAAEGPSHRERHHPPAATEPGGAAEIPDIPALTLRIAYQHGLYHEAPDSRPGRTTDPPDLDSPEKPPHLVAAFNAGIWGYGAPWVATVAHATRALRAPVVVTAYSYEEADDDAVRICAHSSFFSFSCALSYFHLSQHALRGASPPQLTVCAAPRVSCRVDDSSLAAGPPGERRGELPLRLGG